MTRADLKYIELKSGYSDNGPAWIGQVYYSKTGRTIYFYGKAFQRAGRARVAGNFVDIETGEEYWISGIKKDMTDRHWAGNGKVFIDRRILSDYLQVVNRLELDQKRFELIDIDTQVPKARIYNLENDQDNEEN